MKGLSQVNAGQYYPTEIAQDITSAYSRMGAAQAQLDYKREEEERQRKEAKRQRITTGIILGAAALATGGAALAAAPAAGGLMAGLGTFGKGALSAFTGAKTAATGAGGLIGGLNTAGGLLGQVGTNMLTSGGGGGGVEDAAMGALGSYMNETRAANKSSRVMEATLKDPEVRGALFPGVTQEQTDAVLKYKDTLGTIDGAKFLQTAMPMLARNAAGNVDFDRKMKLQGSRIAQQGDVDLNKIGASAMIDAYGRTPIIPAAQTTTGVTFSPIRLGIATGAQGTGF